MSWSTQLIHQKTTDSAEINWLESFRLKLRSSSYIMHIVNSLRNRMGDTHHQNCLYCWKSENHRGIFIPSVKMKKTTHFVLNLKGWEISSWKETSCFTIYYSCTVFCIHKREIFSTAFAFNRRNPFTSTCVRLMHRMVCFVSFVRHTNKVHSQIRM